MKLSPELLAMLGLISPEHYLRLSDKPRKPFSEEAKREKSRQMYEYHARKRATS